MSLTKILQITTPVLFAAAGTLLLSEQVKGHKIENQCRQEIKELGISDKNLSQIAKKADSKFFISDKVITWKEALDSMKKDGLAKKAYFEGQQAVRDSLKRVR